MNVEDLQKLPPHGENVDLNYKGEFPKHLFDNTGQEKDKGVAEFIRDLAAMANAHSEQARYIVYGINDKKIAREVWPEPCTTPVEDSDIFHHFKRYLYTIPTYQDDEFPYKGQLVGLLRIERGRVSACYL